MKEIRLNPHAEIRRETISGDQYCVIVDDFLRDPHELIEFAAQYASEFTMPERPSYPGKLIRVDRHQMTDIYRFIRFQMTRHFPFLKGDMKLSTFLSMVTFRPDELSTLQRLCHTDPTPNPSRTPYAALLYLFENEDLGGTGFYRWKNLELMKKAESIEADDAGKGMPFLQNHSETYREPARYMTGSNDIAEHLCTIPARFNRMIFYSGKVPHSGDITAPELLSTDPRKGRLTLNVFIDAVPK